MINLEVFRPRVADTLLGELRRQGVPDTDITLSRIEVVARAAHDRVEASFVWEDVLGMAWLNARPLARYLAFMFVAGVVPPRRGHQETSYRCSSALRRVEIWAACFKRPLIGASMSALQSQAEAAQARRL